MDDLVLEDLLEAEDPIAYLREALWSGDVKTKWKPPQGFFLQKAKDVASGLKKVSSDFKQAMSRLNFYINRAGKNLSQKQLSELEKAKGELQKVYATA